MGEIFSLKFAQIGNPFHVVRLLLEGFDAQAPLYYVFLSAVNQTFQLQTVISMRLSSDPLLAFLLPS